MNKEVTNIQWNPTDPEQYVIISCADGSSYYTADHVIFTASLGVLKDRHKSLFTPNLPTNKVKVIDTMGFGTLGKIFLEFEEPFWPAEDKDFVGYTFIWKDEDAEKLKNTDKEW